MFRITEDLSTESHVQCLAKNCKNDPIAFFDMNKVILVIFSKIMYKVH